MYHHKRGAKVCGNRLLIRQDKLDGVVLQAIADALDERILERAIEKALLRARRARQSVPDRRAEVQSQLVETDRALANLRRAIERVGADLADSLVAGVREQEARRRQLAAELERLKAGAVAQLDERKLRRDLRERVSDVRRLLEGNVGQTGQILRKLLVGRLVCTPFEEGDVRGYRFTGEGSYEAALPVPTLGVTPARFARFGPELFGLIEVPGTLPRAA